MAISKRIYLDYASAAPVLPNAIAAMRKAEMLAGNPGAIHSEGVAAKRSLEDSRARIAALLGCNARELIFTSGLTESNNLAIIGYARHLKKQRVTLCNTKGNPLLTDAPLSGTHWIVGSTEHDSVLECFSEIEWLGGRVSQVDPDGRGIISPESLSQALRPETVFVSVGWANNEIGTIQPLAKIARKLRKHEKLTSLTCVHKSDLCGCGRKVFFHADAGQAPLYLSTVVSSLGVDLLSLGSNKLYGPHGIGALFVSKRISLAKALFGGAQEKGLRAGTENVALAAGFTAAYEKIAGERAREAKRLKSLRDDLARNLSFSIPGMYINGDVERALPHMLNVSIPVASWRTSEYLALALDARGIAVSTKSACREGEGRRSHAVGALGGEPWRAENTLRFSLGHDTTAAGIRRAAKELVSLWSRPDT